MSATNLSSNVYIAFILSALVETPSLINIWFMSHWGRKPTLVLSLIVAGLGCIIGGLTTGNIRMAFVLLGMFFILVWYSNVKIFVNSNIGLTT